MRGKKSKSAVKAIVLLFSTFINLTVKHILIEVLFSSYGVSVGITTLLMNIN